MNISQIGTAITKAGAKAIFKIKVKSPEILIGLGVVGVVGAVVLACKETSETEKIIEDHKECLSVAKSFVDKEDRMAYGKAVGTVYLNTSWRLIRNYGPAASLLLVSLGCILYSHGIMSKRNLELLAAYKTLEESFSAYRERVRERYGEQAYFDAAFVDEHKDNVREIENADGEMIKVHDVTLSNQASPYARFFDETNINWEKDANLNMFFLQAQEKFANEKLHRQGFVFLNDVYDALGFPKTSVGQLVGWFDGGEGDDFVSFGIDGTTQKKRDFVNGFEPAILLDFNVDGVIYDLI